MVRRFSSCLAMPRKVGGYPIAKGVVRVGCNGLKISSGSGETV